MVLTLKVVVFVTGVASLATGSVLAPAYPPVFPAPVISPAVSYTRAIPYNVPPFAASVNVFTRLPPPLLRIPQQFLVSHVRSIHPPTFGYAPAHPYIPKELPPSPWNPPLPEPYLPETPVAVPAAPHAPLPDPLPITLPGPYHYPAPAQGAYPGIHHGLSGPLPHAISPPLHHIEGAPHFHQGPAYAPLPHHAPAFAPHPHHAPAFAPLPHHAPAFPPLPAPAPLPLQYSHHGPSVPQLAAPVQQLWRR